MVARESNPMRFPFNTISGGKESSVMMCCARRDVMWTNTQNNFMSIYKPIKTAYLTAYLTA
jgi:hypothetical protein